MYDIIKHYPKADADLVAKFAEFDESASISECLAVPGAMNRDIRPVWPGARMCGVAFTAHVRPGDNLLLHKALDLLKPGDVLVVCCEAFADSGGIWGGMMTASAKVKGAAGLVTDGSVRDTMLIKELGFPVYSRGIDVKRSTKKLPGTINHPIIIGGVLVNPGDIVFGDNDAVVVIPQESAREVYDKVRQREEMEAVKLKRILNGEGTTFDLDGGFIAEFKALNISEEPD